MRHRKRGYNTYRGRMTAADRLRIAVGILLALVLLAGAGLLFGQRYIVYTQDGLRLELPFLQQEEQPDPDDGMQNVTVVVEPGASAEEPENVPLMRAVKLPLSAVLDGTALEQARAQGANAVVLEMKDDWGKLGFCSEQELALQVQANGFGPDMNAAIRALAEEEITLIAQISCFRDHAAASEMRCTIETNPGRRWSDGDVVRWSNPAKEPVRAYLTGLARELAQLGFDEILLEHWGYPAREDGHLEYIKRGGDYDPDSLEAVISGFLEEMEASLQDTGAVLSLRGEDGVLRGADDQSGRTLAQLTAVSGHIWVEERERAVQALEQAGAQSRAQDLVVLGSALDGEQTGHQAVLELPAA